VAGHGSPGGEGHLLPFIWRIRQGALAACLRQTTQMPFVDVKQGPSFTLVCVTSRLGAGASLSALPFPSWQASLCEAAAGVLNKLEPCSSPFPPRQRPGQRRHGQLLGGLPGEGSAHHHLHRMGMCRELPRPALHAQLQGHSRQTEQEPALLPSTRQAQQRRRNTTELAAALSSEAITCSLTSSHQRFGFRPSEWGARTPQPPTTLPPPCAGR